MFTVYILHNSIIEKYYIGSTSNISRRLFDHNKRKHASKFTRKQSGIWELVYEENFSTKKEALKREKYIKRMKSKKYILQLVEQSRL